MSYDYQVLLKEKMNKDKNFSQRVNALRAKRKNIVGREAGMNVLGDIPVGRITLAGEAFIRNFKVLRMLGLKWNLTDLLGDKACDGVIYSIGVKLGRDLVSSGIVIGKDPSEFIANFAKFCENMKIGVASVVKWGNKKYPGIVKVDECITCAGMLNVGSRVCHYEGGIIGGAMSEYFKKLIIANETKCWGCGNETCEFELES